MNRRKAIGAMLTAAAVSSVLRPGRLLAQETGSKAMAAEGNTIYLHPARGGRIRIPERKITRFAPWLKPRGASTKAMTRMR